MSIAKAIVKAAKKAAKSKAIKTVCKNCKPVVKRCASCVAK